MNFCSAILAAALIWATFFTRTTSDLKIDLSCPTADEVEDLLFEEGWVFSDCIHKEGNKYGTDVITWFLPDKFGAEQPKKLYEHGWPDSLHGIWPKDRCLIRYKTLKDRITLGLFYNSDERTIVEVADESEKIKKFLSRDKKMFEKLYKLNEDQLRDGYLQTQKTIRGSLYHEYKKHYLQNGKTSCAFFDDFITNFRIGKETLLYPHACRYSKKEKLNLIQQVVSVKDTSRVLVWNGNQTCKLGFEFGISGMEGILRDHEFPFHIVRRRLIPGTIGLNQTTVNGTEPNKIENKEPDDDDDSWVEINDEANEVPDVEAPSANEEPLRKYSTELENRPIYYTYGSFNRFNSTLSTLFYHFRNRKNFTCVFLGNLSDTSKYGMGPLRCTIPDPKDVVLEKIREGCHRNNTAYIAVKEPETFSRKIINIIGNFGYKIVNTTRDSLEHVMNGFESVEEKAGRLHFENKVEFGQKPVVVVKKDIEWLMSTISGLWPLLLKGMCFTVVACFSILKKIKRTLSPKNWHLKRATFVQALWSGRLIYVFSSMIVLIFMYLSSNIGWFDLLFPSLGTLYIFSKYIKFYKSHGILGFLFVVMIHFVASVTFYYNHYRVLVCVDEKDLFMSFVRTVFMIQKNCTIDLVNDTANSSRKIDFLLQSGRLKDNLFYVNVLYSTSWTDFGLSSLHSFIDIFGVAMFLVIYFFHSMMELLSSYLKKRKNAKEFEDGNLSKEDSAIVDENLGYIMRRVVDALFMVMVLITFVYVMATTQFYGRTLDEMEIFSLDNVFRMMTVLTLIISTLDQITIFLPWSRRNLDVLKAMLVTLCLFYKIDEIKTLVECSNDIGTQIYEQLGSTVLMASMVILYLFIVTFKGCFRFMSTWIVLLEIFSLIPLVKLTFFIDKYINFIGYIKETSAEYGYELTELHQVILVAFFITFTINKDFVYRPQKIFKVTTEGVLRCHFGFRRYLMYMVDIFFRVFYLVTALAFSTFFLRIKHQDSWYKFSGWALVFFLLSVLALSLTYWFCYSFYKKVERFEYDVEAGRRGWFLFMIKWIMRLITLSVAGLTLAAGLYFGKLSRQFLFVSNFAPFALAVLFFEILYGIVGTGCTSARNWLAGTAEGDSSGGFLIEVLDKFIKFIKFILSSWKMISYIKAMVNIFSVLHSQITYQHDLVDYASFICQLPVVAFFGLLIFDCMVGFHRFMWKWVFGDDPIFRYDKYERDVDHVTMRNRVNDYDIRDRHIELGEQDIVGVEPTVVSTKDTAHPDKYKASVQGPGSFEEGGHVDNPESYHMNVNGGNVNVQDDDRPVIVDRPRNAFDDRQNLNHLPGDALDEIIEQEEEDEVPEDGNPVEELRIRPRGRRPRPTAERPILVQRSVDNAFDLHEQQTKNIPSVTRHMGLVNTGDAVVCGFVLQGDQYRYGPSSTVMMTEGEIIIEKEEFDRNDKFRKESMYAPVKSYARNKHECRTLQNVMRFSNTTNSEHIIKSCEALKSNKEALDSIDELATIHTFYVKSPVNSVRDEFFELASWPYVSAYLATRIFDSFTAGISVGRILASITPNVVLANLSSAVSDAQDIFSSKIMERDDVITFDEYIMCTNSNFEDVYRMVEKKEIYLLTTKQSKLFLTQSFDVATYMQQQEVNGLDQSFKFSTFEACIVGEEKIVRPYRMQTEFMMCTGNAVFSTKLKLAKKTKVLKCTNFDFYITSGEEIKQVKIENRSMIEVKEPWMLGVLALSTGFVVQGNPQKFANEITVPHLGSCATVRLEGDSDNLYVITNKHVVQSGEDGEQKNFYSPMKTLTKTIRIKHRLNALYTICGEPIVAPMNRCVAFGDDYALFEIDRDVKKYMLSFFQKINVSNPIKVFPTFGEVTSINNVFQSMSRQMDRTLSLNFNKIRQFSTFMMWNSETKEYDIWGYTVPGMSGAPMWDVKPNKISLIGLHSAVESNRINMVHSTRLISGSKIKKHLSCFDIRESKFVPKKGISENCEFPCSTSRLMRVGEKLEGLRLCNGSLNTMELDGIFNKDQWPRMLESKDYILCDDTDKKSEFSNRIFKQQYDSVIHGTEAYASPSLLTPTEVFLNTFENSSTSTRKFDDAKLVNISDQEDLILPTLLEWIDAIREGKLEGARHRKFTGIKWRIDEFFEVKAHYIGGGLWHLGSVSMNVDDNTEMIVDDMALVEFLMATKAVKTNRYRQLVKELLKNARVGKIYTAVYDGKNIVFQEKDNDQVKCSRFCETESVYILTDGEELCGLSKEEYDELQCETRTTDVENIKWLLKKLEQAQLVKMDLDKKMEIIKSKMKDLRSSIDYQEKSRKYNEAMRDFLKKKEENKLSEKENKDLIADLKEKIRQIDTESLKRIKMLNEKKSRIAEIVSKKKDDLKEAKSKISEQYQSRINKLTVEKSKLEEKIKQVREQLKERLNSPQLKSVVAGLEKQIQDISKEISNVHAKGMEEKNKLKNQITDVIGKNIEKPNAVENPEHGPEMMELRSDLIETRQVVNRNLKEQEDLKGKVKALQIKMQECKLTDDEFYDELCVLRDSGDGEVKYSDFIDILYKVTNEMLNRYFFTQDEAVKGQELLKTFAERLDQLDQANKIKDDEIGKLKKEIKELKSNRISYEKSAEFDEEKINHIAMIAELQNDNEMLLCKLSNLSEESKNKETELNDEKAFTLSELSRFQRENDELRKHLKKLEQAIVNKSMEEPCACGICLNCRKKTIKQKNLRLEREENEQRRRQEDSFEPSPPKDQRPPRHGRVQPTHEVISERSSLESVQHVARKKSYSEAVVAEEAKKKTNAKRYQDKKIEFEERQKNDDKDLASPRDEHKPRNQYQKPTGIDREEIKTKKVSWDEFKRVVLADVKERMKTEFGSRRTETFVRYMGVVSPNFYEFRARINDIYYSSEMPFDFEEVKNFLRELKRIEKSKIDLANIFEKYERVLTGKKEKQASLEHEAKRTPVLHVAIENAQARNGKSYLKFFFVDSDQDIKETNEIIDGVINNEIEKVKRVTGGRVNLRETDFYSAFINKENVKTQFVQDFFKEVLPSNVRYIQKLGKSPFYAGIGEEIFDRKKMVVVGRQEDLKKLDNLEERQVFLS
ncbi:ORF1 [Nidovirales sp.]|nr:ORF1 [Nidovirales sp.]